MIDDVLISRGVVTADSSHHHVRPGWIGADCPYCSPGWGKFRLGVEIRTGRIHCWVCGRLKPVKALADLLAISHDQAYVIYRRHFRDAHLRDVEAQESIGVLKVPKGVGPLLPPHIKYLKSRGFEPVTISSTWDVQGIGIHKSLQWRLFIPVYDPNGRMRSWTTRSIRDNGLRYRSASPEEESAPLKTLLYGEHLVKSTIAIVEGPADAWAIGPGAAATLGVAYSKAQLSRLSRFTSRIVCFDAAPDAQRRADELCTILSSLPGTTVNVRFETGDDPGSADPEEIEEFRSAYLDF